MNECKTSQERYEMLRGKLYLIPTGVADHPWSEGGSIKCLLLSYEGQLDFPCIIKIFFFGPLTKTIPQKVMSSTPPELELVAIGKRNTLKSKLSFIQSFPPFHILLLHQKQFFLKTCRVLFLHHTILEFIEEN